jgi:hypothetical protein
MIFYALQAQICERTKKIKAKINNLSIPALIFKTEFFKVEKIFFA